MVVQVQMASPAASHFDFHGRRSSAWVYCISEPTSPCSRTTQFDDFDESDEFAFDVSKAGLQPTVSAAELFHAGKIRPLHPPAIETFDGGGGEVESSTSMTSPLLPSTSPKSSNLKEDHIWSKGRKNFWSAFALKRSKPTNPRGAPSVLADDNDDDNHRGRQRAPISSTSASSRRGTRSLSPLRRPNYSPWEFDHEVDHHHQKESKPSRMRKLKNFLLFRSASEGRASDKLEPLNKFAAFCRTPPNQSDEKSISSSKRINSAGLSAHERHYAMKKAASEDMKKKTFLPYKRGILGR